REIYGTLVLALMKVSTSLATNTEYQSASPINDPTMVPMTNPRIASNSVNHVSDSSSPLAIILYPTAKIPKGEPTRKAEIQPALTPISHNAKNAMTASACSVARPSVVLKETRRRRARGLRFDRGVAS